jgi:hypothetical protein
MPVERRGWVIAFEIGSTGNGRNPIFNGRRQPWQIQVVVATLHEELR